MSTNIFREVVEKYSDARGDLVKLLDGDIKSSLLITSKKGSVRANHYHKKDHHYCYVVSGEIKYLTRPVGSSEGFELYTIEPEKMFYTPEQLEHLMIFSKDTVFLTFSKNSFRSQKEYEDDLVRVDFLSDPKVRDLVEQLQN
jgi:dTDP-4-dehydrorhamnose 3,5-epimerase-like enzyme|tara:strand:+ start:4179 stop:4604 length:426 start_codon:yes stop_codon:yes gene_type:complete